MSAVVDSSFDNNTELCPNRVWEDSCISSTNIEPDLCRWPWWCLESYEGEYLNTQSWKSYDQCGFFAPYVHVCCRTTVSALTCHHYFGCDRQVSQFL